MSDNSLEPPALGCLQSKLLWFHCPVVDPHVVNQARPEDAGGERAADPDVQAAPAAAPRLVCVSLVTSTPSM